MLRMSVEEMRPGSPSVKWERECIKPCRAEMLNEGSKQKKRMIQGKG